MLTKDVVQFLTAKSVKSALAGKTQHYCLSQILTLCDWLMAEALTN